MRTIKAWLFSSPNAAFSNKSYAKFLEVTQKFPLEASPNIPNYFHYGLFLRGVINKSLGERSIIPGIIPGMIAPDRLGSYIGDIYQWL